MSNEYTIYAKWLALALRKQGFRIIRTEINENYPQYDTYIFENSVDLQIAITHLTKKSR
jgi:hypothetical protein